jgi:hypothetical protein
MWLRGEPVSAPISGLVRVGNDWMTTPHLGPERREAQAAADLSALAGVLSLPDSPGDAVADARQVGAAHGYRQSQIVPVTPHGGYRPGRQHERGRPARLDDRGAASTATPSVPSWQRDGRRGS